MFRGWHYHTIDEKGRLSIPTRFRDVLNGRAETHLVITGLNKYLAAYPLSTWRAIEERYSSLPDFDAEARAFLRLFVSGASECTIDKQGRILVPPSLREFARLEKEVALVGMLRSFEIWDKQSFEREMQGYATGEKTINAGEQMTKLKLT
jgi:MraZ protein